MESLDERRRRWDERHAAGDFEGHGPNPSLVAAVEHLAAGRALEIGSGSGTNAVWLARQGWQVTAVDWSTVGLDNGRRAAADAGVEIEWFEQNLLEWSPPARAFDLVAIVYLHLPPDERAPVYRHALDAVAPDGRLVVVAHDRSNLTEGEGGPQDAERLFTATELAAELVPAPGDVAVGQAEVLRRVSPPGRGPIDALVVVHRRASQEQDS